MRLHFPNGEHDDVFFGVGGVAIGSSDDDDICLRIDGVRPRHVELSVEQRGLLLHVPHPDSPVSVNGRRVVETSFLRLGDELDLAGLRLAVTADPGNHREPPSEDVADDGNDDLACAVNLRGINGEWRGRVINLRGQLTIGSDPDSDIVLPDGGEATGARLVRSGHEVYLRSVDGTSLLNGNPVRNAVLEPGDQLQWGDFRFALEAPNPPRPDSHRLSSTAVMQAVPDLSQEPEQPEESGQKTNSHTAWLVAAVLVAAAAAILIAFLMRDVLNAG